MTRRPEQSAAKDTAPQVTAPQVTAPQAAAPQVAAPQVAAPQVAAPPVAAPQAKAPAVTAPVEAARQELATRESAPQEAGPGQPVEQSEVTSTGADEVGTASAGRGTARHAIPGRCADPCAAREASRSRGPDRETTDERSLECRSKIRRCPAGDSRELLCRRRYTAQDRHPAHLDPGRLLLLRTAIARVRPSRLRDGVSSPGSKR